MPTIREEIHPILYSLINCDLSAELNHLIATIQRDDPALALEIESLLAHHVECLISQAFVAGWTMARQPDRLLFEPKGEEDPLRAIKLPRHIPRRSHS